MTEHRNRFRALIDWDNDGFVNRGVPEGATPNLLPYPAYGANLHPKIQTSSGVFEDATYVEDVTEYGNVYIDLTQTAAFPSQIGANIDTSADEYTIINGTYILLPNKNYSLSFYVSGNANLDISVYRTTPNSTTKTLVSTQSNVDVSVLKRVTFSIPSAVTTDCFIITLEGTGGVLAEIQVKGVQLVEGLTQPAFNTGELSGYDDISAFVLTASWELGRNEWDDPIAYEGTARLTLNNQSKRFSPAYSQSPLFGQLRQNLMVVLEYENGINNWVTVWSGWTNQFKTIVGTASTLQAEIICGQGIYRLRDGDLDIEVNQDLTINDAILQILNNCGFRSTYYPFITTLNFDARLGWNTWLQDAEQLFSHISYTNRTMTSVGYEWGRKTTPAEAIEELLRAENSKLWIDRRGGLVLKHREDFINNTPDYTLSLDTGVQEAIYAYGEGVVNHVDVFTKPRKEVTNQVIWSTKNPIYIQGHPFGDGNLNKYTRYIDMQFEFEEGTQRTITSINGASAKDMAVHVYNRNPRFYADPSPYEVPSSEWEGQVHATVLGFASLRKRLQVRNNLEYPVWIDIEITGDYAEGNEGELLSVDDLESQQLISSVQSEKIELNAYTSLEEGLSYANYIIHRKATPIGEFKSIIVMDDITYEIGNVLDLSETQTGEQNRKHVIIGESGDYASGMVVTMEYKLARLDEQTYYAVGDTLSNSNKNLIQNLLENMIVSGGEYDLRTIVTPEGNTAYRFNGGVTGSGILFYGDLEGQHLYNKWNVAIVSNEPLITEDTGVFQNNQRTVIVINTSSGTTKLTEDYSNSLVAINYLTIAGLNLIRLGIDNPSVGSEITARFTTLNSLTPDTVFGSTTITVPASSLRTLEREITFDGSSDDLPIYVRLIHASGASLSVNVGDFTLLHYPTLPTDALSLLEDTTYYLTIWGIIGIDYEMVIKILGEDGTPIYDDIVTFSIGDNKVVIPFTTQIGNADKHALIMYPTNTTTPEQPALDDLYIYGMSITEEIPDTYKETVTIQENLPIVYL